MKRAFACLMAIGLLGGALAAPADAAKKKTKKTERKAEGTYDNPAIGVPGVVGSGAAGGSYEFGTTATESYIDVEIVDDAGADVTFTMSQNSDDSDPQYEIIGTWCGSAADVAIVPALPVRVSVYAGPGVGQFTCTGPATSGTIKATLSNLP